ncbi:MAG: DUF4870 domain-containing protein [Chloroflexi bacterium]|nr:DUF4870 domain-containing protein [Chloroflexota bacterium]
MQIVNEGRLAQPETTRQERTWAALAHLSTLVTLLLGLPSLGLTGVLLVFVPLMIYFAFRDRSEFVAYHAAQAFALQVAGTVGLFAAMLLGVLVLVLGVAIGAVLSVILIGVVVILAVVLVFTVYTLALLLVPFAMMVLSIIATFETGSGKNYQYPYIGRWVASWLSENTSPRPEPPKTGPEADRPRPAQPEEHQEQPTPMV